MKICSPANIELVRVAAGDRCKMTRVPCCRAWPEVLLRAGTKGAVGGELQPHITISLRIDIVARLAAGGLRLGVAPVGHPATRRFSASARQIRPEIGAAAEHIEEALRRAPSRAAPRDCPEREGRRSRNRRVAVARTHPQQFRGKPDQGPPPTRSVQNEPETARFPSVSAARANDRGGRRARAARRRRAACPAAAAGLDATCADRWRS